MWRGKRKENKKNISNKTMKPLDPRTRLERDLLQCNPILAANLSLLATSILSVFQTPSISGLSDCSTNDADTTLFAPSQLCPNLFFFFFFKKKTHQNKCKARDQQQQLLHNATGEQNFLPLNSTMALVR
jgi:hypothetical protein